MVYILMLLPRAVSTGVISLGGNWFSASKGYALTDSDILSHLLVEGGQLPLALLLILKARLQLQAAGHSQLCCFQKKKLFQKFHEVNDTPTG